MTSLDRPAVTVVIPVRNAAGTIGEQLDALSDQEFSGTWEVLVSDNGSTDDLQTVIAVWQGRIPNLRVIDSSATPGAAAARNAAVRCSSAELLAFCDADDRVGEGWLEAMVDALRSHPFVAGAIDHDTMNPGPSASWSFRSHVDAAPLGSRFLPYALSANLGVWRQVFDEVGGFPEDIEGLGSAAGEDMALSWNIQLAGYELHFAPRVIVGYRHRQDTRSFWRQHVAYGYAEAVLFRRFRDRGMPRSRPLGAVRAYLRLLARLNRLRRPDTRGGWVREAAKRWGRIRGSAAERVMYL